jgi:hypothetical protein
LQICFGERFFTGLETPAPPLLFDHGQATTVQSEAVSHLAVSAEFHGDFNCQPERGAFGDLFRDDPLPFHQSSKQRQYLKSRFPNSHPALREIHTPVYLMREPLFESISKFSVPIRGLPWKIGVQIVTMRRLEVILARHSRGRQPHFPKCGFCGLTALS